MRANDANPEQGGCDAYDANGFLSILCPLNGICEKQQKLF